MIEVGGGRAKGPAAARGKRAEECDAHYTKGSVAVGSLLGISLVSSFVCDIGFRQWASAAR